MKNKIKTIITIVFFCFAIQSQSQDKKAISQGISISNFRVDNISDTEIKVIVDYSYFGKTGSEFLIYAFPRDFSKNSLSKNVKMQRVPLKTGNNSVSIMMAKRPQVKNFKSKSIRVCMFSKMKKPYIYCQEFLFSKSWRSATKHPRIISFTAKKINIKKGESTTLGWKTENAYNVSLSGGHPYVQKVKPSGFIRVTPKKTTTYRLNAKRSLETLTRDPGTYKSITVNVDSKTDPEIVFFRISPHKISKGDRVRFYWEVKNAEKVLLYDSYGKIKTAIELPNGKLGWPHKINGAYMENLNKSETYILKAINNFGKVEKTFKVTIRKKTID